MNSNKIHYNTDKQAIDSILESKKMDLESGWLGRVFGAPTHAPNNITGFLIVILVLTGVGMWIFEMQQSADYWSKTIPIITLGLGYLFGKS